MWLLRLGLYELVREKERGDDWVWIMDHTLQLGPMKCLVIVGVRLNVWAQKRGPLCHEELTLLNLTPMEQATGACVHEALLATQAVTGVPRLIVSDGGTELKKGIELLNRTQPEVSHTHDIKHKMALLLKKELEHSDRWNAFVRQSNQAKIGVVQTGLAFLTPATLKVKARYMNLDLLVNWGKKVLQYLERLPTIPGLDVDPAKLATKFGWLHDYRRDLQEWSELLSLAEAAEDYVRHEGYHRGARRALATRLDRVATTKAAKGMRADILDFVGHESALAKSAQERLLGSSEVLESLIGKYKQLQSTHSKGGMTAMLLSIGAIVGRKSDELVRVALSHIRTSAVTEWCRKNLGITIQAQRMAAFSGNKNNIQIEPPAN